jgi:prepilin-type N-terminal cleavage/methylation domain-containing protein/prepilin-type processing-associated H-X9-DG protein
VTWVLRARGYTLVELLVVTAIIAILAGLLMPAVASAREGGRGAACESHLQQVGMATLMYAMDWEGRLPAHWRVEQGYIGIDVFRLLLPYLRDYRILVCPSLPGDWRNVRGYGYNHVYLNYRLLDSVADPAGTIMFCDNSRKPGSNPPAHCFPPGYPGADNGPEPRHNGMTNFVFLDGHVKRLAPAQTVSPVNLWDRR